MDNEIEEPKLVDIKFFWGDLTDATVESLQEENESIDLAIAQGLHEPLDI